MTRSSLALPSHQEHAASAASTSAAATDSDGPGSVTHWQADTVAAGDSFDRLLRRNGVDAGTVHAIASAGKAGASMARIFPGDEFRLGFNDNDRLVRLDYRAGPSQKVEFRRDGDAFEGRVLEQPLQRRLEHATGTIHSSLFAAAARAGLSDRLTMDLVDIFHWNVDFVYSVRAGDRFMVVYEGFYKNGRRVDTGNIVAAEFINRGEIYRAIRYQRANGDVGYYTPAGESTRKAFLRTPVKFTRISSRYGRRYHPILHKVRMHYGVDFAAPRGTPIHATSSGHIVFRGRNGGFGNMVAVRHGKYLTRYGHMTRFARGQHVGSHVDQGDVIGYVGSTGLSTGPHVHYDFEINGHHRNPLTVALPNGTPIPDGKMARFREKTRPLVAQLGTLDRAYAEADE